MKDSLKKGAASLPKGQRPITSFIFQKQISSDPTPTRPSPATTRAVESGVTIIATEQIPQESQPPPAKRARATATHSAVAVDNHQRRPSNASTQLPNSAIWAPSNAHSRHERWQKKILGDESAGMSRIRTQEELKAHSEKQKPTPLELQVADLQRRHPDCVLAIECGYKYRFFGKDAEIASAVCGIFAFPDRNYLTAGVPTVTIDRHVRRLVMAGHKVGVVRQVETAAIKAAGENRNKLFERKLASIYTRATLEAGELSTQAQSPTTVLDGEIGENRENSPAITASGHVASWTNEDKSAYLVCVVEQPCASSVLAQHTVDVGIVAVEISTGEVLYSQVRDDAMRAELESRLMFAAPSDLVMVEPISASTQRLLESYAAHNTRIERVGGHVYAEGGSLSMVSAFYHDGGASQDALDRLAALPHLVVRALAHALEYLRPFKMEAVLRQGASFRNFSEVAELAMSPNALAQLEILRVADAGMGNPERGSLVWLMDRTSTAPGARLLRRWVSRPLRSESAIEERLDAVEELIAGIGGDHPVLGKVPGVLKGLPDLERILARSLHRTASPAEFLQLLQVFAHLHSRLGLHADLDVAADAAFSALLSAGEGNGTCEMEPQLHLDINGISAQLLQHLLRAACDLRCSSLARATLSSIDIAAAATNDKVGLLIDAVRFDDVANRRVDVEAAEAGLQALLPELARLLNVRCVKYVSIQNQGDYLVEVAPELEKRVPKDWDRVSSTKKALRFRPPAVKRGVMALELAREHLIVAANSGWHRLLGEFCEHYAVFRAAVQALAALDCLTSFASLASDRGYVRPVIVPGNAPAQLHIEAGRHPVLDVVLEGAFVPNDLHLEAPSKNMAGKCDQQNSIDMEGNVTMAHTDHGAAQLPRCAVVTGPNMGGKSCFIRQAALIACMAQSGSFVPAASCRLSAFDAIYTRMGAADNIALGRSTFLEELGETSAILQHATSRSLVIIDELGRGTSTRDGKAIAAATLDHMVRSICCLTLFVTHYPEVARMESELEGAMQPYFMAHVVEDADRKQEGDSVPRVTFLYKAVPGIAEASYGLNVARMAGLPDSVVRRAAYQAATLREEGDDQPAVDEGVCRRLGQAAVVALRSARSDGQCNVAAILKVQESILQLNCQ